MNHIIIYLKFKTSVGHDEMTTKSLKQLFPVLLQSLTLIINQSLITGIFTDDLIIAKVIPLHKKNDTTKMDNYRPVSLLPAISKVFEIVAHIQLYSYFRKDELFYTGQCFCFSSLFSSNVCSCLFCIIKWLHIFLLY